MRRFGAPSCPERRFFSISFFLPRWANPGEAVMVYPPLKALRPQQEPAVNGVQEGGMKKYGLLSARSSQCFNRAACSTHGRAGSAGWQLQTSGGCLILSMKKRQQARTLAADFQFSTGCWLAPFLVARAVKWRPFPGGSPVLPPLLVCVRAENSAGFPQSLPCPWAGSR